MRTHYLYVRMHKTRWRYLLLLVLVLLFYSQCSTLRGQYTSGGVGAADLVCTGAGRSSKDRCPHLGAVGPGAKTPGVGNALGFKAKDSCFHREEPSLIARLLRGSGSTVGRLDLWEVEWRAPSNRTPHSTDAHYERGLNVAMPNASSLSLARNEPPWTIDTQCGLFATLSRGVAWLSGTLFSHKAPPYERALSAFFRARQGKTDVLPSCCRARAIHRNVQREVSNYYAFTRAFQLRVPLLLYYNRLPVYAMMQHLRLMRLRNYQLLSYMGRDHASQVRTDMLKDSVAGSPDLHARQLNFELTRLSLVFYLQRLHLRALRHADSMRLETLHFLRYLSSTIPVLRTTWVGQDYCSWPGVSCVVVRVPLNSLIDEDHPAVKALVEEIFSVCRGQQCRQRRCVAPSCSAYTRHLTRRLFTSAAPGYWVKWDRKDDTASMDELMGESAPSSPGGASDSKVVLEAAASSASPGSSSSSSKTAASPHSHSSTHTGTRRDTGGLSGADGEARSNRRTATAYKRSVWTEQVFAYENPNLLLMDPALLVDIDLQNLVQEVLQPSEGDDDARASSTTSTSSDFMDPPSDFTTPEYAEAVERPLVGDLFAMQRSLLQTIAESAPRGLRYGKQRSGSSQVTIPYTFVRVNLASMGLRGYLSDFHHTASVYDERKDAAAVTTSCPNGSSSSDGASHSQSAAERDVLTPRSDVYWGRLSFKRMLRARNLSSASPTTPLRPLASVSAIGRELHRVLRRLEKIGQRNHHHDLATYFSEVASLARFQNEEWSPYRWPEPMATITKDLTHSATRRLHTIFEDNALSMNSTDPVHNIDHNVKVFGELNPRLIGLLSLDISANPLLTHLFPLTWLSIPYLQRVHTTGTSILTPPLQLQPRLYNQSNYCPVYSAQVSEDMKVYTEDATRKKRRRDAAASVGTARDKAEGLSVTARSLHDEDFIGAIVMPPFAKIDAVFSMNTPRETTFEPQDGPITGWCNLDCYRQAVLDEGLVQGFKALLGLQ
ncbi:hypothetical protein JKF63_07418 [Porcisia hertigi]|uniref:Uncharacterized protein n=1 Tax=Porcisia hertigi TaxID=2761500 RepID=A0A836YHP3_9TRYP|nr:hypothetical protein JKF63_07418 [Porcisia hertigi]